MGFFRKKKEILDLTERYKEQQEKLKETEQEPESQSSGGAFSFLGNLAGSQATGETTPESSPEYVDVSTAGEKRRKLAKRLMDMTAKLEDISNQIYHLQQRIEVVERKMGVGSFD